MLTIEKMIEFVYRVKTVSSDDRWKYLRESDDKYFDQKRNTSLREYLQAIFPNTCFVYDEIVPAKILKSRGADDIKRYRPDARSEELSLIVEFDGVDHFNETRVILKEKIRDEYFESLGYKVVHIPYFIQLSKDNIQYLFDTTMSDPMCELEFSFYDSVGQNRGLDCCYGNMCEAGRVKFETLFKLLPHSTQLSLLKDISASRCYAKHVLKVPSDYVMSEDVYSKLFTHVIDTHLDYYEDHDGVTCTCTSFDDICAALRGDKSYIIPKTGAFQTLTTLEDLIRPVIQHCKTTEHNYTVNTEEWQDHHRKHTAEARELICDYVFSLFPKFDPETEPRFDILVYDFVKFQFEKAYS